MKVFIAALALLTMDGACASEFSVGCDGRRPPAGPYFATFDTDARTVVFETSPVNAASSDGINVLAGAIHNIDHQAHGKIEFTVRASDGTINLTYDPEKKEMFWPGIMGGDPFRPTLRHLCVTTPPRSILSFRSSSSILHPVSIRCAEAGYMYFTIDAGSRRVLFERDGGPMYEGAIKAIHGDDMDLETEPRLSGADTVEQESSNDHLRDDRW